MINADREVVAAPQNNAGAQGEWDTRLGGCGVLESVRVLITTHSARGLHWLQ
jgi:hypothetical protein